MSTPLIRDTATVFNREFMPVLRGPAGLAFSMIQPLLFLVLFGPLLGGSGESWGFGGEGGDSPWQWFVPGILLMMCLYGPMQAGYFLLVESMGGSLERLLVTPLNRTAMLIGRSLKEFVILLVQAVLIIAIAVPLGFELHPLGVLAGLGLLVVLGVGLSALSFVLAMWAGPRGDVFWGVTQTILYPLMLLSGVLLPVDAGPAWLRMLAGLNPLTYIVEAERELFAGRFTDMSIVWGSTSAGAIAAVGLVLGIRAMAKGT